MKAKKERKTEKDKATRSEKARRARLAYLAAHPTPRYEFATLRMQRPALMELRSHKPYSVSWGAFMLRLLKEAGYKVTTKL